MDNFFTHIHTHAYTSVETGGCRRIVIRRDWELWWNRGTIDRWKWKIGEHSATVFSHWTVTFRCSRRKNEDLSTDVAISIANPASLLLPLPPLLLSWKHTPFSPNHSRSIARTKRLVRCWLLYCDPYFDTDVLTRCVPIATRSSIISAFYLLLPTDSR